MSDQKRLFHSSETIDVSGGDHTLALAISAIYCGGTGNVVVRLRGDSTDRTFAVTAGQFLYGDFSVVRQTGTTATGLFGLSDR